MPTVVVFTAAARVDVLEAFDWYEARQSGLGQRFTRALDALIDRVLAGPRQFPPIRGSVRRAFLRGFPYCLYFRIMTDRIQVLACLHTSRDPITWRRRN